MDILSILALNPLIMSPVESYVISSAASALPTNSQAKHL